MDNGVGFGVYEGKDRTKLSISLRIHAMILQAEVTAIPIRLLYYNCASILNELGSRHKIIAIGSDSQAVGTKGLLTLWAT